MDADNDNDNEDTADNGDTTDAGDDDEEEEEEKKDDEETRVNGMELYRIIRRSVNLSTSSLSRLRLPVMLYTRNSSNIWLTHT